VIRPRAADDFAAIRARMEELRQEREGTEPSEKRLQRDPPLPRGGVIRWPPSESSGGPGRVRQSGAYAARLGGGLRGVSDPSQSAAASAVARRIERAL
jgi:hypothetical protein